MIRVLKLVIVIIEKDSVPRTKNAVNRIINDILKLDKKTELLIISCLSIVI